jgi:hypothetical protein
MVGDIIRKLIPNKTESSENKYNTTSKHVVRKALCFGAAPLTIRNCCVTKSSKCAFQLDLPHWCVENFAVCKVHKFLKFSC